MTTSIRIDAKGLHYTPLNQKIRAAIADGAKEIVIDNVLGQRFIGDGIRGDGCYYHGQRCSRGGPRHVHERTDDHRSRQC